MLKFIIISKWYKLLKQRRKEKFYKIKNNENHTYLYIHKQLNKTCIHIILSYRIKFKKKIKINYKIIEILK